MDRSIKGSVIAVARCLRKDGMYQLTAVDAMNHFLPLYRISDGSGFHISLTFITSLQICCPPCTWGIMVWLSVLLDAQHAWLCRLVQYSDKRGVRPPSSGVASILYSPPFLRWREPPVTPAKKGSDLLPTGQVGETQTGKSEQSFKNIYRLRRSGLARLVIKHIHVPAPSEIRKQPFTIIYFVLIKNISGNEIFVLVIPFFGCAVHLTETIKGGISIIHALSLSFIRYVLYSGRDDI